MNYCRTCKFWSINANMIGVGNCTNLNALMSLQLSQGYFTTAQNYGCCFHIQGESDARLYPKEVERALLQEFLLDRYEIDLTLCASNPSPAKS